MQFLVRISDKELRKLLIKSFLAGCNYALTSHIADFGYLDNAKSFADKELNNIKVQSNEQTK